MPQSLTALALVCTLKRSPDESSSELMANQFLEQLADHDVSGSSVRVVDLDVAPGVEADMGDGDEWPQVKAKIEEADILVVVTPTWLGHMSSVAQRALERLDAELSEERDDGNPMLFGKVAVVGVVGNEDGAHKITADLYQALNDVGYTIPAQGGTYWNGEAMNTTDYLDLDTSPEPTADALATACANAAHLARALGEQPYPS